MRRIPPGILFAVVLGFSAEGRAYVRGVTAEQAPYFWPTGCVPVTVYTNGYTGLSRDEIAKSIGAAAQTWGSSVTCPSGAPPSFEIMVAMADDGATAEEASDGRSVVVFRDADWPYGALALTTHHANQASGRIFDTDIEINPNVLWVNLDPGAPPETHAQARTDLQAVMTHEFGHFIGLAHSCYSPPGEGSDSADDTPASLVDDSGAPIPRCTPAPDATNAAAAASVMWNTIDTESIAKRTLAPDDVRTVCEMFPPAAGAACPFNLPDDGCGCSASRPRGGVAAVAAVSSLILWLRRRRHRRRPSSS